MEETTSTQGMEQAAGGVGEETQTQQTGEHTAEKLNAFQKFMNELFGGGKGSEGAEKKEETPAEKNTFEEKNFTQKDMDAAIEAAKQKWQEEAAEAERMKKLTPEEQAKEEQLKKDSEIAGLKQQLLEKELRESALKSLEKDGFPTGLADVLDYSSRERMEETLKNTMAVFKGSLEAAVKTRLKGKTPEGLGGAASAENLLRDQIAKNIRGL